MEYVFIGILVVSTLLIGGLMLAQSGEPPARGREAPAFDLPGTDGARHSPATWKGRPVVLYREAAPRIEAAGARLFAVAVATPDEAKAYAQAQSIPFPVLADESGRAAKAWGTLTNFGFYKFAKKLTVIVDAGGRVERLWRDGVGPGHVDEVLAALGSRTG
jgi:peroxiredoxin Q/BCP